MKAKLVFTLFLLIIYFIQYTNAQSFVNSTNRWHVLVSCTGSEPFGGSEVLAYFFKDSTLINERIYLQMYKTLDTTFQTAIPTGFFYREENSKVYLFREGFSERLIYDFNLRSGDTLAASDELQIKVLSVDSITLNNGERRKRLSIQDNSSYTDKTTTWIAGIGSEVAPLDTRAMFVSDCGSSLNCFYQENELLYQTSFFGRPNDCTLYGEPVSVNEIPELADMQVFPNPFTTELFLDAVLQKDFPLKADYSVSVYDVQGKQMYHEKARWINNLRIETTTWRSGLYALVIRSANGVLSRKLIKI